MNLRNFRQEQLVFCLFAKRKNRILVFWTMDLSYCRTTLLDLGLDRHHHHPHLTYFFCTFIAAIIMVTTTTTMTMIITITITVTIAIEKKRVPIPTNFRGRVVSFSVGVPAQN